MSTENETQAVEAVLHVLYLRLPLDELDRIRKAAHNAGKSVNKWCVAVLNAEAEKQINEKAGEKETEWLGQ